MNPQLFEHITALLSEYLDKASRAVMDVPEQPTLQYILAQVQKIAADTEYITQAIQPLTETKSHGIGIGAGNIIKEREKTNRKLLDFYKRLYNDLPSVKGITKMEEPEITPADISAQAMKFAKQTLDRMENQSKP